MTRKAITLGTLSLVVVSAFAYVWLLPDVKNNYFRKLVSPAEKPSPIQLFEIESGSINASKDLIQEELINQKPIEARSQENYQTYEVPLPEDPRLAEIARRSDFYQAYADRLRTQTVSELAL